jgi:hypothetical protein
MSARAYVVTLTIPDNAAYTALTTLTRMGLPIDEVRRADVWLVDVDDARVEALDRLVPTIEGIFNPNKHRLEIRSDVGPRRGEVWITARDEAPAMTIGGRTLEGVRGTRRATAWRLLDVRGDDVPEAVREAAAETFLCNPAFQSVVLS